MARLQDDEADVLSPVVPPLVAQIVRTWLLRSKQGNVRDERVFYRQFLPGFDFNGDIVGAPLLVAQQKQTHH